MKRKGDLVKNVLGILLTVIGLVVFFIALARLYNVHANQESENAKRTIDSVIKKIDALSEGQATELILQGFTGAEKWCVVGWNDLSSSERNALQKCFFSTCTCICKAPSLTGTPTSYRLALATSCQKDGFCRIPANALPVSSVGAIRPNAPFGSSYATQTFVDPCIRLTSHLQSLKVERTKTLFTLTADPLEVYQVPSEHDQKVIDDYENSRQPAGSQGPV